MGQYPYLTLNEYYREIFGKKIAKIPLDGGFTCPNRDGTLDTGGCIFCSTDGSGDFVQGATLPISQQIKNGKEMMSRKWKDVDYIAYFQAFTNTYAPVEELRQKYNEALCQPNIVGISIATRPDCLDKEVLNLLDEVNQKTKLWIELGLQSGHEESAKFIHRGYTNQVFETSVENLNNLNIPIVVHVILGLPNETKDDMLNTIRYLNKFPIQGIKLQLMHVIEGTHLANLYKQGKYTPLEQDEYLNILTECIQELRPDIVVHRFTGDGKKEILLAPLWSLKKGDIMNGFHQKLKQENIHQGQRYSQNN